MSSFFSNPNFSCFIIIGTLSISVEAKIKWFKVKQNGKKKRSKVKEWNREV